MTARVNRSNSKIVGHRPGPPTFEDVITKPEYTLSSVRSYRTTGEISLLIYKNFDINQRFEVSLKLIKEKKRNITFCPPPDGRYESILELYKFDSDGSACGCIEQKPEFLRLLASHFLRIKIEFNPEPFDFAKSCLDIYKYCNKLIHVDYITKNAVIQNHLNSLNEATNLVPAQLLQIKKLHTRCFPLERWKNEKNAALLHYLRKECNNGQTEFHCEYAQKFCEDNLPTIIDAVRGYFPEETQISFAGTKSTMRIAQKLAEYSQRYLKAGIHAFKEFKDLFRASITCDAYIDFLKKGSISPDMKISSINQKTGVYQACYVILNVHSINFELKIVKDLDASLQSHDWYELQRNGSVENLRDFVRGGILRQPPSTDFQELFKSKKRKI